MRTTVLILLAVSMAAVASPVRAQPSHIAYQGELSANGTPFNGAADMKMAIVENGLTKWSNDGSSTFGSEPVASFAVAVSGGIFSVRVGDASLGMDPLTAEAFDLAGISSVLRVWVNTGDGFEQLPDQPLSSSLFSIVSDASKRSVSNFTVGGQLMLSPTGLEFADGSVLTTAPVSDADTTWVDTGSDIYRINGNVGIGTQVPAFKLSVVGGAQFDFGGNQVQVSTPGGWPGLIAYSTNGHRRDVIFDDLGIRLLAGSSSSAPYDTQGLLITQAGWLGVGKVPEHTLDVYGDIKGFDLTLGDDTGDYIKMPTNYTAYGGFVQVFGPGGDTDPGVELRGTGYVGLYNTAGATTATLNGQAYAGGSQMRLYRGTGSLGVEMTGGASEIKCFDTSSQARVIITGQDGNGQGKVTTDVLQITGGSDLSEGFDITGSGSEVEPGLVVSIDPVNPGHLRVSDRPYQKTVAGVVSGAGGVRTGLIMGQTGTKADGKHPVALTGRVWTYCDAGYGAIEPGDLLTTSATPGYAMLASDPDRTRGTVIGKAMTGLDGGRGLVLVLVGLQ
jgi:hypothetical protein